MTSARRDRAARRGPSRTATTSRGPTFTVDIVERAPLGVGRPWLRRLVRRAVRKIREDERLPIPLDGEMAIIAVDVPRMRELNARHRGKKRATDVLSFPQEAAGVIGPHLGDVVICTDVARENALLARRSYRNEVAVLAIHGVLHLLGYDHETDRGEMHALERSLRGSLDLGDLGDEDRL